MAKEIGLQIQIFAVKLIVLHNACVYWVVTQSIDLWPFSKSLLHATQPTDRDKAADAAGVGCIGSLTQLYLLKPPTKEPCIGVWGLDNSFVELN